MDSLETILPMQTTQVAFYRVSQERNLEELHFLLGLIRNIHMEQPITHPGPCRNFRRAAMCHFSQRDLSFFIMALSCSFSQGASSGI